MTPTKANVSISKAKPAKQAVTRLHWGRVLLHLRVPLYLCTLGVYDAHTEYMEDDELHMGCCSAERCTLFRAKLVT